MVFKDKLRDLRVRKRLTQTDVAKAIGVSTSTICCYELGKRKPENNTLWKLLADYFGVTVDYLKCDDENSKDSVVEIKNFGCDGYINVDCLIDKKTGVNYIVVKSLDGSVAITPRLNVNGSLYKNEV